MYWFLRKIHMYVGLFNFSFLFVLGVTGLLATRQPAPDQRVRPEPDVEFREFHPQAGATDREVVRQAYAFLHLPLAGPPPPSPRRNSANDLELTFYSPNGVRRVSILEKENRLRMETARNSVWQYFSVLHETSIRNNSLDLRVRMWTWYNELGVWSLIFMSLSGVYLWLSARPGYFWGQVAFGIGSGGFLVLYWMTR